MKFDYISPVVEMILVSVEDVLTDSALDTEEIPLN